MKKSIILLLVVGMLAFSFAGCAQEPDADLEDDTGDVETPSDDANTPHDGEGQEVRLAAVNWAEGIAMSNLAKVILEDKMNYDVELTIADVGPIFATVANGDYDVFMETWLPITHQHYIDEYGDDLVDLGYSFEDAKIGLVVPDYVDIDSIEELNENADKFNGQITGIDAAAGVMAATERALVDYDLKDMELMTSSGPMMTAALKKAIDEEEWIVVTGWKPHWKFARWDLKFLEDPEASFGASENIHIFSRLGFEEDLPAVAQFLKDFYFTDEQLGDLMDFFVENEDMDLEDIAREWMDDHEELVNSWLS